MKFPSLLQFGNLGWTGPVSSSAWTRTQNVSCSFFARRRIPVAVLLRKTDFVHGFVVDIKHLLFDSLPFVSSDVLSSFRSRSPRLPLPRLHSPAARPRWYGSIINNIKLSCITGSLPRFTDFRECAAACKMDTISARPHCQGLSGIKGSASRPALSTFCKIHL